MGLYIDRQDKLEWLLKNAVKAYDSVEISALEFIRENEAGNALICFMDNGPFQAAGIATDKREYERFAWPDGRPKIWFAVPKAKIIEEVPYIKGYGIFKQGNK